MRTTVFMNSGDSGSFQCMFDCATMCRETATKSEHSRQEVGHTSTMGPDELQGWP